MANARLQLTGTVPGLHFSFLVLPSICPVFKTILTILMAYITIAGLVTFSLFILEESFQTVMFGTWSAQDAKRWDIVKMGCDLMDKTARTIHLLNYTLGWIQPIAFISYRFYAISSSYYVKSLRAKCFAYAPELFEGEKVSFNFTPDTFETLDDSSILATSGKIGVFT
jgi:hypothetical protein